MRWLLALVLMLIAAGTSQAADGPKASGTIDGKSLKIAETSVAEGVKAACRLLESCRDESLDQADERLRATQGDHLRFVLANPVTVTVMGEKLEVSELLIRQPLNTGVLWVQSEGKWRRFAKFEFQRVGPFESWLEQAPRAD